jgi:hypothetical protein
LEEVIGPRQARSRPAQPPTAQAASTDASRPGQSGDERAIRAVDEQLVRDYNRGDSKALAALFTDDAESIEA